MSVLDLADYRRHVAELYAHVRAETSPEKAHSNFVARRNQLFANHPQSALNPKQKASFEGLEYFPYNSNYRFVVEPDFAVKPELVDIKLRDDGKVQLRRVAYLSIPFPEASATLSLFWITGYGGGRYLLDTIKHADLGQEGQKLILDFNFAYNSSCAYSSLWDCPLAPFENKLELAILAGEKVFDFNP